MVRGDDGILPHAMGNQVLVNGEDECLANVDIVERLHQVIHGVVVDPQMRHQLILVVRQRLRCARSAEGTCPAIVGLARLVRFEIRVRLFVERVNQLRQLGVGSIVVGVRH